MAVSTTAWILGGAVAGREVQGNINRADDAKDRRDIKAAQDKDIAEEKASALTVRKRMIDKQRTQLLGVGDDQYSTKRSSGSINSMSATGEETLG